MVVPDSCCALPPAQYQRIAYQYSTGLVHIQYHDSTSVAQAGA